MENRDKEEKKMGREGGERVKIQLQNESKNKKYRLLHVPMMRLPGFTSMSVTCSMGKKVAIQC